ncbi:MAG: aminoacyl-histidine dipeptidase [Eubacteriales bacterium]|nr:aminoacyl-histidine dipeptidase [Eubacteriales bacterium]
MSVLEMLKPQRVFYYFEEICRIPHGSGNTREISDYLAGFAREQGLAFVQDEKNNVVIYKEAFPGYEEAPTVILQGHMDMVCEKRPDVEHDFTRDGLKLSVTEDGYVTANGTTLGGDDGIAVAYILAILESRDIPHPALEAVITVDEEIGLLGAAALDCSVLKGRRLINIDSEEEGSLLVGCAGGMCGECVIPVKRMDAEGMICQVRITGLAGGHSGGEIDKNRANANILMGRFLYRLKKEMGFGLLELFGGTKDNAITRECQAVIMADEEELETLERLARETEEELQREYAGSDEGIRIQVTREEVRCASILHPTSMEKTLFFLMNVPWGVAKMSGTAAGLVETSSNLGVLRLCQEALEAVVSIRSSIGSASKALSQRVEYLTEFLGGEYEVSGAYPAWEYRKDSPLRDCMVRVYEEVYGEKPEVTVIHAGLECGLFYEKMEGLDCVSVGPDIVDIHTSEERLSITSTERVWNYLLKVLEALKD